MPPSQRNNYDCEKSATGPLNRKKLIEHINKQALETPDVPELEPYVPGVVRGKKWMPPPPDDKQREADEKIAIDLGDEYEQALTDASQEEIIDLAGKLSIDPKLTHARAPLQTSPAHAANIARALHNKRAIDCIHRREAIAALITCVHSIRNRLLLFSRSFRKACVRRCAHA